MANRAVATRPALPVGRPPAPPTGRFTYAARRRLRHRLLGSNGPRRYLTPDLTLDQFFDVLRHEGVPYAVLRWFDQLPSVDPGEDVDLLVADEYLDLLHALLRPRPAGRNSQAFDVYTVSGLPGTDFGGGVPYYPPRFAEGLVARAVTLRGRYRVPDPEDHFLSLAYHAVYHKGYASGLRSELRPDRRHPVSDHDYDLVLKSLAAELGTVTDVTLEALDSLLADRGLRPPLDTLERLAPGNTWIHDRFLADRPGVDPVWGGLAAFVIRERATAHVDLVLEELGRHGFEVLEVLRLDRAERASVSERVRGGNWARGPWAVSGGEPGVVVVAYDVAPWLEVPDDVSSNNLRIAEAKAKIRERVLAGLPPAEQYNPLHSSDNPRQALDYLDALGRPDLLERTRRAAEALAESCRMPFPVVRRLAPDGPRRRAQIAVVEHPEHGLGVCKVYRPGARRFLDREIAARRQLADLPLVPRLLDHGENWLVTTLYRDDGRQVQRRLPFMTAYDDAVQLRPAASRALAAFGRALHERGYFVLDLTTENLISDSAAGLKVVDLEFLQRYAGEPPPLAASYTFRGVPPAERHRYDEPQDVPLTDRAGNQVFHPAVAGLPVESLLRPPRPGDALRCRATHLQWYLRLGATRAERRLRGTVGRSRPGRVAKRALRKAVSTVRARRTW